MDPVIPAAPPKKPAVWRRPKVWLVLFIVVLCGTGTATLYVLQSEVGLGGFIGGMLFAAVPVPLVLWGLVWLDRPDPGPVRNVVLSFAWGACAATLTAMLLNSWFRIQVGDLSPVSEHDADRLTAIAGAPVVEEIGKAVVVLLVLWFRRRELRGITDGIVLAGASAAGFAFVENILYIGSGFVDDVNEAGDDESNAPGAVLIFLARGALSPFAHPLFTSMTGIGIALAVMSRRKAARVLWPLAGLGGAMLLHALWNAGAMVHQAAFMLLYALLFAPTLGGVIWLAVWDRQRVLAAAREQLPRYAEAGWLEPMEIAALGSRAARRAGRDFVTGWHGKQAGKEYDAYVRAATRLARLRAGHADVLGEVPRAGVGDATAFGAPVPDAAVFGAGGASGLGAGVPGAGGFDAGASDTGGVAAGDGGSADPAGTSDFGAVPGGALPGAAVSGVGASEPAAASAPARREQEYLEAIWQRRHLIRPALLYAASSRGRWVPVPVGGPGPGPGPGAAVPAPSAPIPPAKPAARGDKLATTALVLAIAGVLIGATMQLFWLAYPLGAAALAFGAGAWARVRAGRSTARGISRAAVTLGGAAVVLSAIGMLLFFEYSDSVPDETRPKEGIGVRD
ncbi:PrsW family intramembrane metalloprotease [Streptomyces boninensis]|uniref:PrsW family intramembrane metalloprotease n=1 Tax=Streptomyces boninensis TaxID=2039455 RepID=UPI003B223C0F